MSYKLPIVKKLSDKMTEKPVFTTFEAAKICHVSPLSIINWVNAGRLSAFRTPGGHRRIRREAIDAEVPVGAAISVSLANPKSNTFACPSSVTKMLSGFRSR